MRYPKYLINAFAILGIASFIFLACSAAETTMNEDPIENGGDNDGDNGDGGDNNPPIQNNYGKYQIATSNADANFDINITILNTETGQVSLYKANNYNTQPFTLLRTENIAN